MSPHTQLAAAVLGAVLTAAAAAYYAWHRGRELHREMDAVLDHLARFENNLIGEPGDPEGGELGRQSRNLERLRLIVESEPPLPTRGACFAPSPAINLGGDGDAEQFTCGLPAGHDGAHEANIGDGELMRWADRSPEPQREPDDPPPATARMPVIAALIPTTSGPATGPADIPPTDGNGDPPQQPSARAYSLTGPRPRPPGAHRPPKEREA